MNKKYIELAERAGFSLWGKESWNPGDVIDWSARYDKELESFADMIVQECCLKLLDMDEKTKGDHNYYKHASLKIKEHFELKNERTIS